MYLSLRTPAKNQAKQCISGVGQNLSLLLSTICTGFFGSFFLVWYSLCRILLNISNIPKRYIEGSTRMVLGQVTEMLLRKERDTMFYYIYS